MSGGSDGRGALVVDSFIQRPHRCRHPALVDSQSAGCRAPPGSPISPMRYGTGTSSPAFDPPKHPSFPSSQTEPSGKHSPPCPDGAPLFVVKDTHEPNRADGAGAGRGDFSRFEPLTKTY